MKKRIIALTVAVIAVLSLAGCGGSSGAKSDYYAETSDAYSSGNYYAGEEGLAAADAEGYYEAEYGNETAAETSSASTLDQGTSVEKADSLEKLVYRANVSIETTGYADTVKAVENTISKYSGIIQSRDETDSNSRWYYSDYIKTSGTMYSTIVVRIPTANYRNFLNELDGVGKMTRKSENVENISRVYADTSATVEALKTQQSRLLEMLKDAESVEDMIYIEQRLSEVESDLNYYNSYLSSMDTDVEYSTITIDISEVVEYSPDSTPTKKNTFTDRLKNTLSDTWDAFKGALEVLLNVLIFTFPFLLVAGLIFMAIFLPIRKGRKKRQAKKKQEELQKNPPV